MVIGCRKWIDVGLSTGEKHEYISETVILTCNRIDFKCNGKVIKSNGWKIYEEALKATFGIEANPFHRIKVKFKETAVLPRIIPKNEIEQLLHYMYSGCEERTGLERNYWLRDIAVVEFFFGTGARVYEISNISADCVDLNTGAVKIMGIGGKERYILISAADVLQLLCEYYEKNQDAIKESGYFFVNKRGDRFTEQSIRLMIKKYVKLARIERNITPHMFRHSFVNVFVCER